MTKPLPWDQRQRFRFIEAHLIWRGSLSAAILRDSFDVSTTRAEKDLALYARMAPNNFVRDAQTGVFTLTDDFVPQFLHGSASDYLSVLRNQDLGHAHALALSASGDLVAETLHVPAREFDVRVLARLNTAIREQRFLSIDYQSMTHPEPRRLRIAPHVLVFAGRWHARAWSETHESYRDFLLSRIAGIPELQEACTRRSEQDWDWQRDAAVRIAPHPELSPAQKRVVEQDYGMHHGLLETRVRLALVPYYLRLLGVGRGDHARPAAEQQIVLLNAADLDALNRLS